MLDFSPLMNALSDPVNAFLNGNMGTSAFLAILILVAVGFLLAFFGLRLFRLILTVGVFGGGVALGYLLLSKFLEGIVGIVAGPAVGIVLGLVLCRLVNWLYNRLLFILFTPLLLILTSVLGSFLVAFSVGGFLPFSMSNVIVTVVLGLIAIFVQTKAAIRAKKDRLLGRFGKIMSGFGYNAGTVSDDFVGGFLRGYGK